jgi:hypothetical protein
MQNKDMIEKTSEADRRRIAYHEAGHAVLACHFGMPVNSVTLGDSEGQVSRESTGVDFVDAVVAYAGLEAECRYMGVDADNVILTGQFSDALRALGVLSARADRLTDLGLDGDAALLDEIADATAQARWIVAAEWSGIERVAGALLSEGRLTGAELAGLLPI